MTTTRTTPGPEQLEDVIALLRTWQREDGPFHLHPGDLGWHHLRGAESTAEHLRLWQRDGAPVAIGLLDGTDLVRTAIDPALAGDEELARALADSLDDPARGVLPAGPVAVEAHSALRLRTELLTRGWVEGERWVPLRRALDAGVEGTDLAVEEVGPGAAGEYTAVHRSAFDSPGVTDERYGTMRTGPAHREAVSLLGRDEDGSAVGIITVWSAGEGRPGLVEPMGVHADHRRRGHGRAICLAAAARLRRMGASSAVVCTPSSQAGAVETYLAAGFTAGPEVADLERRPAP